MLIRNPAGYRIRVECQRGRQVHLSPTGVLHRSDPARICRACPTYKKFRAQEFCPNGCNWLTRRRRFASYGSAARETRADTLQSKTSPGRAARSTPTAPTSPVHPSGEFTRQSEIGDVIIQNGALRLTSLSCAIWSKSFGAIRTHLSCSTFTPGADRERAMESQPCHHAGDFYASRGTNRRIRQGRRSSARRTEKTGSPKTLLSHEPLISRVRFARISTCS